MTAVQLSYARTELVRTRVLEGVAKVLSRGEALTFANVALASGVPERTCYRHFATKEVLLAAVFDWANARIGFDGERPTDAQSLSNQVRRVFPEFDAIAPVIRELLIAPEGRVARLADNDARQRAALAVVRHEAPDLDRKSARRLAAIVQVLTAAATWQSLRDYWDMDGREAGEAAALALALLFEGARGRQGKNARPRRTKTRATGKERRS